MSQISVSKADYVAPSLVAYGDINEMTKNVNTLGGGDVLFNLLQQVS